MPLGESIAEQIREAEQRLIEEMNSNDPSSIRMQTLRDILLSPEFYEIGIRLIAQNQLWENQVNRYGQKLPLYKPDTIRKKNKLGHPADKLVNYTNYWTGGFYNEGINVEVNLEGNSYDFTIVGKWANFIPEDRVGLTPENQEVFEAQVAEELNRRLNRWFWQQYENIEITL